MVKTEHEIVEKVYAAKTDSQAADALIQQYLGFIRNEVARAVYRTDNGREDEESIAMFAFYEAILSYEKGRGAFLSYAARAIRNRLIDYYRKEKRHGKIISLDTPFQAEDEGIRLMDTLADRVPTTLTATPTGRQASRKSGNLKKSWRNSGFPFPTWRTTAPGKSALFPPVSGRWNTRGSIRSSWSSSFAAESLPVSELSAGSGTDRKTMETAPEISRGHPAGIHQRL